ncbi:MAG TPA: GNAT family N-acetyltransferase [Acidimicrobiales bacterium]|nr:GNAT family N-acetyltransferase [Acidimicrobiales bacterium]
MRLRLARPDEARLLTELALRSKRYWGYDEAFLETCSDELRLTAEEVCQLHVTVAENDDGRIVGFYALRGATDDDADVSFFFVDPDVIGTGIGRILFAYLVEAALSAGFSRFRIDSDPGAAGFYERMGAVFVGNVPARSVPGRLLPSYRFDVLSPEQ